MTMKNWLTILIADDQRLFADGLRVVIESRAPQFQVVGIAENGKQAVSMVREHRPDIVLMDVRMPEMDGVEATRIIHQRYPEVKVLILTTFSDDEYVRNSLDYGAVGYLLKNRPAEELVEAIRGIGMGIVQIDQAVSGKVLHSTEKREADYGEFKARLHTLSPRECEILAHMAEAKRIAVIAQELGIAEQTVRNHISNIYFKLHIHDRLEIINFITPIQEFLAGGQ
jgi:DNA-binding NarL/FixJ family response regulator